MPGQVRKLDQRGYALIWMAMLLIVLVGFSGFSVDTAKLWYSGLKMQKAADAASLAGVVFLPGDLVGGVAEARKVATQNGFTDGVNGDTVTPIQDPSNPDRMIVTISHTEPTAFVSVLGVKNVRLTRKATSEYQGPVPMGSPTNNIGNQPSWTGTSTWPAGTSLTTAQATANVTPQLWAQIAGPSTDKIQGDRFTSSYCSTGVYNCTGGVNLEPQVVESGGTYGYYYKVKMTVTAADLTKRLSLQVYDPAFIQQGAACDDFSSSNNDETTFENSIATSSGTAHPNWNPNSATADAYCPGDTIYRTGFTAPTTYFKVFKPDDTPWNNTDNVAVNNTTYCNEANDYNATRARYLGTFPAINAGLSTNTANATPGASSLNHLLKSSTGGWAAQYAQLVFHNYVTVCNASMTDLGITTAGTYEAVLRIRSGAGEGANRFAIRGSFVADVNDATPDGSKVSLYADGRLPMFMNASGAQTIFYIARLLPNNGSHTLELNLYDVGDAGASGSIQILPPIEATSGGSALTTFTNCTFSRAPTALTAGYAVPSTCTVNSVNSSNGYNGNLTVVAVPIPANYSCASTDRFGCWVRVKFTYPSGTSVHDVTTWTANLKGDPVRLIS